MKIVKASLVGISGLIVLLPALPMLKLDPFIPTIESLKALMLFVAEMLCFTAIGLSFNRKEKIKAVSSSFFTKIVLFSLLLSISTASGYMFFLNSKKLVGNRKELVLIKPLWNSPKVDSKILKYGSFEQWEKIEGIFAIQRFFEKDAESGRGIIWSQVILIALYSLIFSFSLITILFVVHRM